VNFFKSRAVVLIAAERTAEVRVENFARVVDGGARIADVGVRDRIRIEDAVTRGRYDVDRTGYSSRSSRCSSRT